MQGLGDSGGCQIVSKESYIVNNSEVVEKVCVSWLASCRSQLASFHGEACDLELLSPLMYSVAPGGGGRIGGFAAAVE